MSEIGISLPELTKAVTSMEMFGRLAVFAVQAGVRKYEGAFSIFVSGGQLRYSEPYTPDGSAENQGLDPSNKLEVGALLCSNGKVADTLFHSHPGDPSGTGDVRRGPSMADLRLLAELHPKIPGFIIGTFTLHKQPFDHGELTLCRAKPAGFDPSKLEPYASAQTFEEQCAIMAEAGIGCIAIKYTDAKIFGLARLPELYE